MHADKQNGHTKVIFSSDATNRLFKGLDWNALVSLQIKPPYTPKVSSASDTSNFSTYPDSDRLSPAIKSADDPFLEW